MEIKIYYEDTDCGGVVYYANYLRFFERARTELLSEKGISLADYQKEGIIFTVVRAELDYRSPAQYGDILQIDTKIDKIKSSSFIVNYNVRRKTDQKLIVTGLTKMACVSDRMKPIHIPENIRTVLNQAK